MGTRAKNRLPEKRDFDPDHKWAIATRCVVPGFKFIKNTLSFFIYRLVNTAEWIVGFFSVWQDKQDDKNDTFLIPKLPGGNAYST